MHYLAATVASICLIVLWLTHPARGMTRLLSPDLVAITMLASIFAIRPFVRKFTLGLYGQNLSDEYIDRAVGAGIVGMIAFTFGCLMVRRRENEFRIRPPSRRELRLGSGGLLVLTVLGLLAYVGILTAIVGPAAVLAMGGGRSADVVTAGVPAIVMMIPLAGPVAGAAMVIGTRADVKLGLVRVVALLSTSALSIAALSQLGNRRFIIPAALIPIIAVVARRKIGVRPQYLLLGVAGLLVVAIIPMVRSAGSRRDGESFVDAILRYANDQGLLGIIEPVFASNDTEMLDFLGLVMQRMDDGLQAFGLGRGTIGDFLTAPLPTSIFSGTSFADEVLIGIWGGGCGQPACPVASVVGVSYFDGGLIGVVLGCLLFGIFMRILARRLTMIETLSDWPALVAVVASSYAIVLTRTNTINAIWWVIYTIVIAAIVYALSTRRVPKAIVAETGPRSDLARLPMKSQPHSFG